jgi:dihydroorotase
MATINAARLLGRSHEIGCIRVGQPAEISVLRLEEREWKAVDSQRGTIQARQALVPIYAIRSETIYEPVPIERP